MTAAQCQGLSCEMRPSVTNPEIVWHHNRYPRGRFETTRIVCVLLIVERNKHSSLFSEDEYDSNRWKQLPEQDSDSI